MKLFMLTLIVTSLTFIQCKKKGCMQSVAVNYDSNANKDDGSCIYIPRYGPFLIVNIKFDSTQSRLDNFGQPATIPPGNAAQSPVFQSYSTNYIELSQNSTTQLGDGEIIYKGVETTLGGSNAIDFSKAIVKANDETFFKIPLSKITNDTYNWLRISLTYQNYEIKYRASGYDLTGRLASFVGFNTYITDYTINNQSLNINANKLQGYWGFETVGQIYQGQSPQTTVSNPLSTTSPVPAGSCVVTGDFDVPFTISGNETEDIVLTISLSINNSFEWSDANSNGIYEPNDGDTVVDMGLRGLKPIIQ